MAMGSSWVKPWAWASPAAAAAAFNVLDSTHDHDETAAVTPHACLREHCLKRVGECTVRVRAAWWGSQWAVPSTQRTSQVTLTCTRPKYHAPRRTPWYGDACALQSRMQMQTRGRARNQYYERRETTREGNVDGGRGVRVAMSIGNGNRWRWRWSRRQERKRKLESVEPAKWQCQ